MWGAVDNFVYFAGGPDVTFGNGNESYPPANVFTFPGEVTALAALPAGLVVFTASDMFVIYGTSTATFYSNVYQRNLGVASQNCVCLDGDNLYIYSNQRQLWCFSDSLSEIGYNVAPILSSTFAPASTYLTMHRNGEDVGLYVSDGSTNYLRYIPTGDLGGGPMTSWSTLCQIVGGASAFQSIETSPGTYTLLVGSDEGSGFISARSLTSWTDIGGTYPCSAIVGSLIVSPPGATAKVDYLTMQWMPTGTTPVISILADEIATITGVGPWVTLNGVTDPPKLVPSKTITQQRFYLKSASQPVAQEMCHTMIRIAYPAANTNDTVLTLGIT